MNNTTIAQYIQELLAIDPTLAEHVNELESLLPKLLEAKPDSKPSPQFVAELRLKLNSAKAPKTSLLPSRLLASGFVVALAVIAILTASIVRKTDTQINGRRLASNAFGSLAALHVNQGNANTNSANSSADTAAQKASAPLSSESSMSGSGASSVAGTATSDLLYPNYNTVYEYSFAEGAIPQLPATADVYRVNDKQVFSGAQLPEQLRFARGVAEINQLLFWQDGYQFSYNQDSSLSAYSVEATIDSAPAVAVDTSSSLTNVQVPEQKQIQYDKNKLQAVASNFFSTYNLSLNLYAQPEQGYGSLYSLATEKIAENALFYALKLNNLPVYNQYSTEGISVSFDINSTKVTGMYGYRFSNFDRSSYELTADKQTLLSRISQQYESVGGGLLYPSMAEDSIAGSGSASSGSATESSDIQSSAPSRPDADPQAIHVRRTLTDGELVFLREDTTENGKTITYFVPALRLTVSEAVENSGELKQIVVPVLR